MHPVDQSFPSGDDDQRQHRRFPERKVGRLRRDEISVDGRELRQRSLYPADAANHSIDLVAFPECSHIRAELLDDSGHIESEDRRRWMPGMRGNAFLNLEVERIDAAGLDPHQDLTPGRTGSRDGRHAQRATVLLQDGCLHGLRHCILVCKGPHNVERQNARVHGSDEVRGRDRLRDPVSASRRRSKRRTYRTVSRHLMAPCMRKTANGATVFGARNSGWRTASPILESAIR